MSENYCNNCGKLGHYYHHCKMPITSIGIIVFRYSTSGTIEYLMIRRKDTLGYIDFMRGKYSIYNKEYIMNMLKQMTYDEKEVLCNNDFDTAWKRVWGNDSISNQYKSEETISREKFQLLQSGVFNKSYYYTLTSMIEESNQYGRWEEAEWGFPKGRRNYQEKDFECAMREFTEETGYNYHYLRNIQNLLPFEEIFTGSNYKSYKHKYYLTYMDYKLSLNMKAFDPTEVSKMEWKSYEDCVKSIRGYNLEKKRLISNINNTLTLFSLISGAGKI
jgi:ADP-ribose pyrophosphatase YjhB (NUDIX family)